MSYLNQAQDPRRKATAVAGVIAVHVAVGALLVTGLEFTGLIEHDRRIISTFIPDPVKPPPPPPVDDPAPQPPRQEYIAPTPPIDLTPITPILPKPFDPQVIPDPIVPHATPSFIPTPTPRPAFAPKRAAPRNDPSRWVLTDDYPSRPLREGVEGVAGFRVVVGSDGKVDACEITSSSGNALLDEATCKYVSRRAKFDPATDGNGQKVVGNYSSTVRWQIPN